MFAFPHSAHVRRCVVLVVAAVLALAASAGQGTAARASFIPGLSAGSFNSTLVQQGFVCTGPRHAGDKMFWLCQKSDGAVSEYVHLWGSNPSRIDTVEAGVICFEGTVARHAQLLFSLVAGLSFSGKQPTVARTWLADSVHSGGALDWRGLSLRVDATRQGRALRIAPR